MIGSAPGEEETSGHEAVQRLDIWEPPEREMSLLMLVNSFYFSGAMRVDILRIVHIPRFIACFTRYLDGAKLFPLL
jgi:hypothetical protein